MTGGRSGLGFREAFAGGGPVLLLSGGFPDAERCRWRRREVELKGEVFAGTVDDGVATEDELFAVVEVGENFVVEVFDGDGLPLVDGIFAGAFADDGGDDAGVAVDGGIDLEVAGADPGDGVVSAAAAGDEPEIGGLAGEFEIELDDGVMELGVF